MKAILAAAALLLAAACSDASGPDGAVRVRTNASVYHLPGGGSSPVSVHFTVRNTGSEPIAIPDCGASVGAILERYESGAWVQMMSCLNLPVNFPPRVLAPGEVAQGEESVFEPGRYRLRVQVAEEGAELTYAVSPDFVAVR